MASHTGKKRQLATSRIVRTHSVGITNHLDVCGSEMVPLLCEGPMPTNEEVRSAEVAPAVSADRCVNSQLQESKQREPIKDLPIQDSPSLSVLGIATAARIDESLDAATTPTTTPEWRGKNKACCRDGERRFRRGTSMLHAAARTRDRTRWNAPRHQSRVVRAVPNS